MAQYINEKGELKWNGGRREGSGRKPKEKTFVDTGAAEKRKLFCSLVSREDFEEIVRNYIRDAKFKPQQAEFMINQLIGKACQSVELGGKDGGPLELVISQM